MPIVSCVYCSATEVGELLTLIIIFSSDDLLPHVRYDICSYVADTVQWAHNFLDTPIANSEEDRSILLSKLPFLRVLNYHYMRNGAWSPVKRLTRNVQQYEENFYCATQFIAFIISHTSHLKWESKLVAQTIKTLVVNGFISCLFFTCSKNMDALEYFMSLGKLRAKLNHFDCCQTATLLV